MDSGSVHALTLRVVTYNVLSPPLCYVQHFPHCQPEDLDEEKRWTRVLAKLEQISSADSLPTVICLQEVTERWAARFHSHFQRRGWHFVFALTPLTVAQPMGVALAWPNSALELDDLLILQLGAEVQIPKPPEQSWLRWILSVVTFGRLNRSLPELEPWAVAAKKQNRLLAARLFHRPTGRGFTVATYHMPCLFEKPVQRQAKAIHSAILRSSALRFAAGCDLILAGDFNTKPQDSELSLVQAGVMETSDEAYPPDAGDLSLASLLPCHGTALRSAYAQALGGEPSFTNYAWPEIRAEPFRETLDYIFVTERVLVVGVQDLPKTMLGEPVFPTAEEPSDHVLLAADLCLGSH